MSGVVVSALIGAFVGLLISGVMLGVGVRKMRSARGYRDSGKELWDASHEMLNQAAAQREMVPKIEVRHLEEPVLRDLQLMVVRLPDADFRLNQAGELVPVTDFAHAKVSEADFVVCISEDGTISVVKWRYQSAESIMAWTYLGR